jgi:hypothetical protein
MEQNEFKELEENNLNVPAEIEGPEEPLSNDANPIPSAVGGKELAVPETRCASYWGHFSNNWTKMIH